MNPNIKERVVELVMDYFEKHGINQNGPQCNDSVRDALYLVVDIAQVLEDEKLQRGNG